MAIGIDSKELLELSIKTISVPDAIKALNPDIEALRGLGDESNISFDRRLAETTRKAREKLQQSDIASRRGEGGTGGTALTRAVGQNIGNYARTVGDAHARAVEEADYRNRQLAMQSRMQAGQLGLASTQQGLQGLSLAQSGELGQLQMTAQDLAQRRGIHSQERQYMAQDALGRARYSHEQAQARNLWNQTNASNQNQWNLQALAGKAAAANTRTFEDVVTKKKGSAGLGGAFLTAGGAYLGAMAGNPVLGAQIGSSLASSSGDWGDDSMSGAIQSGAGMYSAYNQGAGNTGGTGGTYNPTTIADKTQQPWYQKMFGPSDPIVTGGGRGDILNFGGGVTGTSGYYNMNVPNRHTWATQANYGYTPEQLRYMRMFSSGNTGVS